MAPRLRSLATAHRLPFRARPCRELLSARLAPRRGYADKKQPATGPNQDVLPHVSEEAAQVGKTTGEPAPDLSQGTPVKEVLKRDQRGKDNAPDVLKEEVSKAKIKSTPISSKADRPAGLQHATERTNAKKKGPGSINQISERSSSLAPKTKAVPVHSKLGRRKVGTKVPWGQNYFGENMPGLKYENLQLDWFPKMSKLKKRYEPIVEQVTKLLMQHGKLGVAQRNMAFILNYLRTTAPPVQDPKRPWVPGTPPAHHLPLNPIVYLATAIDSVAPLIRMKRIAGGAAGGLPLDLAHPLQSRQRRRIAVKWILEAVGKKPSRGSGKNTFATRFAEELVAVTEGRSPVWEKRLQLHKMGAAARTNKRKVQQRRY